MSIYLDYNATAPLHPAAEAALQAHLATGPSNPSSIHRSGQRARRALEEARETLARLLGVAASELVFTASCTEANAIVLTSARRTGRPRLLACAVEHDSVRQALAGDPRIEWLPVDGDGRLDLAAAERALGPDVSAISCQLANNETGVLQPVRELALLARNHGVLVHCDAAQAVGKMAVDFSELGVDYLTAAPHKYGGGVGCGILLARRGAPLLPLVAGHQERGRRGGTENVAATAAAAAALAALAPELTANARRVGALRDRLEQDLTARIPETRGNGAGARLHNTSNLTFAGAPGEALLIGLDLEGVEASSGAACSSGTLEPSHVLLAMGRSQEEAACSVRFSLGPATTNAEIERVIEVLPPLVASVRRHERSA